MVAQQALGIRLAVQVCVPGDLPVAVIRLLAGERLGAGPVNREVVGGAILHQVAVAGRDQGLQAPGRIGIPLQPLEGLLQAVVLILPPRALGQEVEALGVCLGR